MDLVWRTYIGDVILSESVTIPDSPEDLNWHAFLGHSIDMQGFRAAEFAGVDRMSKEAPGFVPLRPRGIGVSELGELWGGPRIRDHLTKGCTGTPLATTLDVLRSEGGDTGRSLAQAFETCPFRKGHWAVRALLQNSAALKPHGYSFRTWLQAQCEELGELAFPPPDFRRRVRPGGPSLEHALRDRLQRAFYQVGPALAPYMICDWQLGLWLSGNTAVFASFKLDSFHEEFVARYGRDLVPPGEDGFAEWWFSLYPELPPRLANECIWLGREKGIV